MSNLHFPSHFLCSSFRRQSDTRLTPVWCQQVCWNWWRSFWMGLQYLWRRNRAFAFSLHQFLVFFALYQSDLGLTPVWRPSDINLPPACVLRHFVLAVLTPSWFQSDDCSPCLMRHRIAFGTSKYFGVRENITNPKQNKNVLWSSTMPTCVRLVSDGCQTNVRLARTYSSTSMSRKRRKLKRQSHHWPYKIKSLNFVGSVVHLAASWLPNKFDATGDMVSQVSDRLCQTGFSWVSNSCHTGAYDKLIQILNANASKCMISGQAVWLLFFVSVAARAEFL